jgi:hypothetical protein
MKGPVGQARPVGQQVLEGDRSFRRVGLVERAVERAQDAHLRKLRRPTRNWVV